MECRPLTAADVAAAPAWLKQADLRPDRWRDESTRAAAGWEGDEVVAVGRVYTSRVHASRYWTEIVVAPQLRGCGHGRQMAAHLVGLRPEPKPLCTRGYVSSDEVSFARHLGARPYQTCPPQQVQTADAARLASEGWETESGSAVSWQELQRAWVDTYVWLHADWSPVAPGFEEPLLAGFRADVDLSHTRVTATPTVRAAAYVFLDDAGPVVVAECRTRTEPDGLELLRGCVRASLLSLAGIGIATATFDGHNSDPHFRPLLDELPTTGEPFELLEWTTHDSR